MNYTCITCHKVGTIDDHYTYKTKSGIKPLPKCKKCHNIGNYTKKGTGWDLIDPEVQAKVIAMLADRTNKIKDIAEEHGLSANSLGRWFSAGKCVLATTN